MTGDSRFTVSRGAAILAAAALLAIGAAGSYVLMRSRSPHASASTVATAPAASATPSASDAAHGAAPAGAAWPDVVVPLTADAAARAGIAIAAVRSGRSSSQLRLPGVIAPNAYRQVAVTPLVSGRITKVEAELGAHVRRGQALAEIYSPELADAEMRFLAARAKLDAHDRELQRTQKLVEIGAASRQEVEALHAEHAAQTAEVQTLRSRLELLGLAPATIETLGPGRAVTSTIGIVAPGDGVITERNANAGVNVDPSVKLFTVVDLSTVWVVADLYEKDFAQVRVGSDATVAVPAFPGFSERGRVSYIDPQVDPATRTARVRVEVPNARGQLRLGMYAEVVTAGAGAHDVALIPRSAVQNVGDRTVVYVANPDAANSFIEREVRLGSVSGDEVEVLTGVAAGDSVVTQGSFLVRAERERLGLRSPAATAMAREGSAAAGARGGAGAPALPPATAASGGHSAEAVKVELNEEGYKPSSVTVVAGQPARIAFVRTTDKTCGTEIVFPSLNITRPLPLNQPVLIEFTPEKSGEVAFECGMKMLRGTVVVQPPH
jgi:RND family efflux transporter MFP subunit